MISDQKLITILVLAALAAYAMAGMINLPEDEQSARRRSSALATDAQ